MAQKYTRFIVVGNGRSGSNLVVLALRQHLDIQMYGEVLADDETERAKAFLGARPVYHDGEGVTEYLKRLLSFESSWGARDAVGFKIFYNHARKDREIRRAWDYLIADKTIRVIHLVRRNLFECMVSHEVAYRTNIWAVSVFDKNPVPTVARLSIEPRECEVFFKTMLADRASALRSFKRHPHLIVEYEKDLCGDFQGTMNRVFDFLNVRVQNVSKLLVKQGTLTPGRQVSNYDELKDFFSRTEFATFFE